jgi:hypothetical protein
MSARKFKSTILATAAVGALAMGLASGSAHAVNIGGVVLDAGTTFEVGSIFENIITGNGQELHGYGEISSIDGKNAFEFDGTGFCQSGCELTYTFGGFTSTNVTASTVDFTGGWINFYVDFTPDFTGTGDTATNEGLASDGTLWLTLAGEPQGLDMIVIEGSGNNIGSGVETGTGAGMLNVDLTGTANGNTAGAGALANVAFDTDSFIDGDGDMADIVLNSDFGTATPQGDLAGECALVDVGGGVMVPGGILNPDLTCLVGSADITANVISEPGSLAALGLGLLGLGALRRRRTAVA